MTHTPGPWQVMPAERAIHSWVVGDREGGSVADCSPPGPWMKGAEANANAVLTAAAPELLAACKLQHQAIDMLFARLIYLDKTFFPSKSGAPWDAANAGLAAIAKAEQPP